MTAIKLCPKCSQQVSVPAIAEEETEVRCPLCSAEYKLADAISSGLPELIIIGGPVREAESADLDGPTVDFGEALEAGTETLGDDWPAHDDSTESDAAATGSGIWKQPDGEASESVATAVADEEQASSDEAGDVGAPFGAGAVAVADRAKGAAPKKRRRGPGFVGQMVGIVVFGIIGLGLGYGILKIFWPEKARPFDKQIDSVRVWVSSFWTQPQVSQSEQSTPSGFGPLTGKGGGLKPGTFDPASPPTAPRSADGFASIAQEVPRIVITPPAKDTGASSVPDDAGSGEESDIGKGAPTAAKSLGPRGTKSVGTEQVQQLLGAARAALEASPGTVNRDVYMSLSALGQALALAENPTDPEVERARQFAVDALKSLAEKENQPRLAAYSHQWLFSGKRPPDKTGVLVLGRVEKVATLRTALGNLTETRLRVGDGDGAEEISVISVERPDYHVHQIAAVLGTIVSEPSAQLGWYPGSEPQLILSGVATRVSDKKR